MRSMSEYKNVEFLDRHYQVGLLEELEKHYPSFINVCGMQVNGIRNMFYLHDHGLVELHEKSIALECVNDGGCEKIRLRLTAKGYDFLQEAIVEREMPIPHNDTLQNVSEVLKAFRDY